MTVVAVAYGRERGKQPGGPQTTRPQISFDHFDEESTCKGSSINNKSATSLAYLMWDRS